MKNSGIAWGMWVVVFAASWPWTLSAADETGDKPAVTFVELERVRSHSWTLPNGKTLDGSWGMTTTVSSDDPRAIEVVKHHYEEMKELIAQKKGYRLLKVYGQEKEGGKLYKYKFTFADGSQEIKEFGIPLETVASWDDFLKKREEEEDNRHEQINKAIVAGRYRLKHVETHYKFTCRDAGSEEKYQVRFLPLPKGKQMALISPIDTDDKQQKTTFSKTTWKEHLQAVRKGEREILSDDTTKTYYYEMVLEDGSKTNFPSAETLK
jgi:hypothetical protein